jgi:hypothetical protein
MIYAIVDYSSEAPPGSAAFKTQCSPRTLAAVAQSQFHWKSFVFIENDSYSLEIIYPKFRKETYHVDGKLSPTAAIKPGSGSQSESVNRSGHRFYG